MQIDHWLYDIWYFIICVIICFLIQQNFVWMVTGFLLFVWSLIDFFLFHHKSNVQLLPINWLYDSVFDLG